MSFQPVNLVLLSVPPLDVQPQNLPRWWAYLTTVDTAATVAGAGYFNIDPNQLLQDVNFNIGDQVYCVCSDAVNLLTFTAVGATGTTTVASSVGVGAISNANVAAGAAIAFSKLAALPSAQLLVGSAGNVPTAVPLTGAVSITNTGLTALAANAVTTAAITNANVTLAKLAAGITPSHIVKFAGQPTTVGGAAAEAFAVAGVLATDLAFVQIVDDGTANVTVLQAVCTADTLTVTFSANPGADVVFNYQILRAAA